MNIHLFFVAKLAEFRPAIVQLYKKGKSIREISALLDVPYTTVQKHLKIWEETGSNADRHGAVVQELQGLLKMFKRSRVESSEITH